MAVDKFKFVSPGIFIDEIDESAVDPAAAHMGPLIIGRFAKGPSNRPTRVDSFKELVSVFGSPSDGTTFGDSWRGNEPTAPTYAAYAAQAWLKNNSPCTIYRVLGENRSDATTANGQAGWNLTNTFAKDSAIGTNGGAYGLFIMPSASAATSPVTGTLAAVWYVDAGAVMLSGTSRDGAANTLAAGTLIKATNNTFKAVISGSSGVLKTATFDFTKESRKFIRKVFNTNPTLLNTDLTSTTQKYWLGETFESNVTNGLNSNLAVSGVEFTGTETHGAILALDGTSESNIVWADHKKTANAAQTGWFFSQDLRGASAGFDATLEAHVQKLFKFHALDSGAHANRDYKISVQDIKPSSNNYNDFGAFTVLVRRGDDTDQNPVVLERFSNVNLNPKSTNYIERAIGDRNYNFNSDSKVITELGNYPNRSTIIRVEVNPDVGLGMAKAGWLPFGVYGPVVPTTMEVTSGSVAIATSGWADGSGSLSGDTLLSDHPTGDILHVGASNISASLKFPTTRLRVSSSEGSFVKATKAYFGYQSNLINTKRFDNASVDLLRAGPAGLDQFTKASDTANQYSWVFTLDDVRASSQDSSHVYHQSGSRASGDSLTAVSGSTFILTGSSGGVSFAFNRFTSPLFGGFDGFDIKEKDPFRNDFIKETQGEKTNYAYYSLKKAIDATSDPEYVEYDVAVMPGITNSSLNTQLINSCEERGDAIAIVDLEGNYTPPEHSTSDEKDRLGSVDEVVNAAKDLGLNTSYGCTFYPYVQIRDTISDSVLYVPPSVVALGTFSSSQRKSAVWFAPAGFTRGGLSEGSAGLPVIGVRQRLTSDDRDRLYEVNVNPIATFPAEGIVIFGQKTLQVTPSALDRINVRRLMIYVKKEVSRIAATTLFEQNVQGTWDRFKGRVIPFLEEVQSGLGLTDFRVILDETTTTPDLVDRNILYAKIFLKPARSIEFIALDFIITKSGASFDD